MIEQREQLYEIDDVLRVLFLGGIICTEGGDETWYYKFEDNELKCRYKNTSDGWVKSLSFNTLSGMAESAFEGGGKVFIEDLSGIDGDGEVDVSKVNRSSKPGSYEVQDGCHNCMFRFNNRMKPEYVRVIYCCYPYTLPPIDKDFDDLSLEEYNIVDEWAEGRYTDKQGICDKHERRES